MSEVKLHLHPKFLLCPAASCPSASMDTYYSFVSVSCFMWYRMMSWVWWMSLRWRCVVLIVRVVWWLLHAGIRWLQESHRKFAEHFKTKGCWELRTKTTFIQRENTMSHCISPQPPKWMANHLPSISMLYCFSVTALLSSSIILPNTPSFCVCLQVVLYIQFLLLKHGVTMGLAFFFCLDFYFVVKQYTSWLFSSISSLGIAVRKEVEVLDFRMTTWTACRIGKRGGQNIKRTFWKLSCIWKNIFLPVWQLCSLSSVTMSCVSAEKKKEATIASLYLLLPSACWQHTK